ncbi:MAG: hypothetical protein DMD85_14315 [Candidatus Rokuibacteriota bacterium]|nr:MAG: hypothetical protein DMD85_14315 [Candidatus Rokubacteria bacterium]
MSSERLVGHLSVDDSARRLRNYRYAEERLMRVLGGWIALTPELPAKLLFGRHVWDCAQHADAWGRRLPELRAPAQTSEPANDAMIAFMQLLESPERPQQTLERIAGAYGVLKSHLVTVYARHLASTNPVYEPPTRRILARCLEEERRHAAAGAVVLDRLTRDDHGRERVATWQRSLLAALEKAGGVTGDSAVPLVDPALLGVAPEVVVPDLVAVPPDFDPAALPADLAGAADAHRRALERGDAAGVAGWTEATARDAVAAAVASLGGRITGTRIVGLAAIGRQRMVKLRLEGPRAVAFVQLRWTPTPSGWRIAAGDLVSTEPISAVP